MATPNQIMALAVFILAAFRGGAENNQPSVRISSSPGKVHPWPHRHGRELSARDATLAQLFHLSHSLIETIGKRPSPLPRSTSIVI
jgi:hypothetical protein